MNIQSGTAIVQPYSSPRIAARFNLDDPDERYIVEVMQRFHGEDRFYRAHAVRRCENRTGERIVLELATFQPVRRDLEWLLIHWNIDEISARFQPCRSHHGALAAFCAPLTTKPLKGVRMAKPPKQNQEAPLTMEGGARTPISMPLAEFERILSSALQVPPPPPSSEKKESRTKARKR